MPSNVRPLTGKGKPQLADTRVQTAGRILTYFSAAYIAITFLCSLAPADPSRGVSSNGPRRGYHTTRSGRCDPFSIPGWVDWSIGTNELPAWRTFDPSAFIT